MVRVGGLTVPPLGVDIVDENTNVLCLGRNQTTNALKVVGIQSLLVQAPGTRGDALIASKKAGVFAGALGRKAAAAAAATTTDGSSIGVYRHVVVVATCLSRMPMLMLVRV